MILSQVVNDCLRFSLPVRPATQDFALPASPPSRSRRRSCGAQHIGGDFGLSRRIFAPPVGSRFPRKTRRARPPGLSTGFSARGPKGEQTAVESRRRGALMRRRIAASECETPQFLEKARRAAVRRPGREISTGRHRLAGAAALFPDRPDAFLQESPQVFFPNCFDFMGNRPQRFRGLAEPRFHGFRLKRPTGTSAFRAGPRVGLRADPRFWRGCEAARCLRSTTGAPSTRRMLEWRGF